MNTVLRIYRRSRQKVSGFTLIELALSMAVSGIIFLMLITLYKSYRVVEMQDQMFDRVELATTALSNFLGRQSEINGISRYPCPAYPDVPLDDNEAGFEQCAAFDAIAVGDCDRGLCKIQGRVIDGTPSVILVGALPYRTIKTGIQIPKCYDVTAGPVGEGGVEIDCGDPNAYNPNEAALNGVNMREVLDPWYFQMTYAVTEGLTDPATYKGGNGGINIQTEDGVDLVSPVGSAEYVLLSHGDNHMGAYNAFGNIQVPCVNGTADFENCDATLPGGNNLFISGLRSMGAGATYYDDLLEYRAFQITSLWNTPSGTTDIFNNNPGNIGIGTDTPEAKLDIDGNLRSSDTVKASQVCDYVGNNCFDPALLGGGEGTAIGCSGIDGSGNPEVMTGIVNQAAECSGMAPPALSTGVSCPAGEYIKGFRSDGTVICGLPIQ